MEGSPTTAGSVGSNPAVSNRAISCNGTKEYRNRQPGKTGTS